MKSRLNRFSLLPLTLSILLSLLVSFSLPAVREASQGAVNKAFPVSYDISFGGESSLTKTLPVRFEGDVAVIGTMGAQRRIPVSSAVFSCNDRQEITRNTLRTALLFAISTMALYSLPLSLICISCLPCKRRMSQTSRARAHIRTHAAVRSPIPEAA